MKSFCVRFATTAILAVLTLTTARAQDPGSSPAPQSQNSASQPSQPAQKPSQNQGKPSDSSAKNLPDKVQPATGASTQNAENSKRILGIIPNFISANDTSANQEPLTVHEKFILSLHQMFDVSAHLGNLLQSAVSQASNGQPHYGQGWGAFGERFAASEGDQMTSCFFVYGVLPSVLHDDPRYFRRGRGSVGSRIWYAASRTVITRKDSGGSTFNVPQTLGQLIQQGISTSYYPPRDRTVSAVFTQWGINLTYNSGYNMLREFMPDLGQYLARRKSKKAAQSQTPVPPPTSTQSN
ncbi:MAG: hypothetical protein WCC03_09890 [Candidatus Acidiferrales bacterium]